MLHYVHDNAGASQLGELVVDASHHLRRERDIFASMRTAKHLDEDRWASRRLWCEPLSFNRLKFDASAKKATSARQPAKAKPTSTPARPRRKEPLKPAEALVADLSDPTVEMALDDLAGPEGRAEVHPSPAATDQESILSCRGIDMAYGPVQTSEALTNPSSKGFLMFALVIASGVARADFTGCLVTGSVTLPVARASAAEVSPLIRSIASFEARPASRSVFL